ncbi:phage tail protein [Azospirillum argentinense]
MKTALLVSALSFTNFSIGVAQVTNSCDLLLQHGISEITTTMSAQHSIAYKWHKYCGIDFASASDGTIANASLTVLGYGSGDAGYNTNQQRTKLVQWCDQNRAFASSRSDLFEQAQTLSVAALSSWNQCIDMARKDIRIKFLPTGEHSKFVHFEIDSTHDGALKYLGLQVRNFTCTERMIRSATNQVVDVNSQPDIGSANIQIDCERTPPEIKEQEGVGQVTYDEAYISVNTSGPALAVGFPKAVSQYHVTPPRSVLAFNTQACPPGWKEFTVARGRTLVGVGQGEGLTSRALGQTGGAEQHTLSINELPSHNHGGATGGSSVGSFVEFPVRGPVSGAFDGVVQFSVSDHTHAVNAEGGGKAHPNMPPFVALLFCERN